MAHRYRRVDRVSREDKWEHQMLMWYVLIGVGILCTIGVTVPVAIWASTRDTRGTTCVETSDCEPAEPSVCTEYACTAGGTCTETPLDDGIVCFQQTDACDVYACSAGQCVQQPGEPAPDLNTKDGCCPTNETIASDADCIVCVSDVECAFNTTDTPYDDACVAGVCDGVCTLDFLDGAVCATDGCVTMGCAGGQCSTVDAVTECSDIADGCCLDECTVENDADCAAENACLSDDDCTHLNDACSVGRCDVNTLSATCTEQTIIACGTEDGCCPEFNCRREDDPDCWGEPCATDTQCDDPAYPVCNIDTCGECVDDTDCGDGGQCARSLGAICVECVSNDDCQARYGFDYYCNADTHACQANRCNSDEGCENVYPAALGAGYCCNRRCHVAYAAFVETCPLSTSEAGTIVTNIQPPDCDEFKTSWSTDILFCKVDSCFDASTDCYSENVLDTCIDGSCAQCEAQTGTKLCTDDARRCLDRSPSNLSGNQCVQCTSDEQCNEACDTTCDEEVCFFDPACREGGDYVCDTSVWRCVAAEYTIDG